MKIYADSSPPCAVLQRHTAELQLSLKKLQNCRFLTEFFPNVCVQFAWNPAPSEELIHYDACYCETSWFLALCILSHFKKWPTGNS